MADRRGLGPHPHQQTGAPAHDGIVPVRVVQGVVKNIDPVKYTCEVVDTHGGEHPGVTIMPQYINEDGGGSFFMPSVNSTVMLMFPSDRRSPIIMGGSALPRQLDEGDEEEDPNDFRMNRPVIQGGDQAMTSGDGNFVIMRKGGVIEIGSSQVAQRLYIPLSNLITDICENYQLVNSGGTISFRSRREDERHGEGRTPVEFRMKIKDFSQDPPLIDVGLGRMADEDDELLVDGQTGQVIAKVIIAGEDGEAGTFRYWIDKDGNVQCYAHGTHTTTCSGSRKAHVFKDFFQEVRGIHRTKVGKSRELRVRQSEYHEVGRDRSTWVKGNDYELVDGVVTRTTGPLDETINGAVDRTIEGFKKEEVIGGGEQFVTDDYTLDVGRSYHLKVGTRWTVTIANAEPDPNPLNPAASVVVAQGELSIHNILGKTRLTVGTTAQTPLAEIVLNPSAVGSIKITSLVTMASIEVNSSGVSIQTPSGEITLDQAGTVNLGPKATSATGGVVTTMSHPTDYVTGLPIMGSNSVTAGMLAPTPTGVSFPAAFTSDPT
jgi:hypothetical protein